MAEQIRIDAAEVRFALLRNETTGGLSLTGAALLTMSMANVSGTNLYHDLLHAKIGPMLFDRLGPMTMHMLKSEGLMALFLLLVGAELQRKFPEGRLSRWSDQTMPAVAARPRLTLLRGEDPHPPGIATPGHDEIRRPAFRRAGHAASGERPSACIYLIQIVAPDRTSKHLLQGPNLSPAN